MTQRLEVTFADGFRLDGWGTAEVEHGTLFADGDNTVTRGDVCYLRIERGGWLRRGLGENRRLLPGAYVICRGGLYRRVHA